MPCVEILIVSYLGDHGWLVHCLTSVRNFCDEFSGVTLLVPEVERAEFTSFPESHGVRVACYDRATDPVLWHLDHQRMKSHADVVCPEAEIILHVDLDCVFTDRATPDDYCLGGRPVLVVKPYSTFRSTSPPGQACTEAAVGWAVHHETMCRLPIVHWCDLYPTLRSRVEAVHGRPFDEYVLGCALTFPWGFSEFNALGQVALSEAWRDRYHIVDKSVREWLGRVGVKTLFIEPGSPWENGYVESFNGKLRDELLEREAFDTLLEAKVLIERWRQHYNTIRPHSALGYRPPAPEARQPCAVASATPRQPHRAGLLEGKTLT